MKKQLTAPQTKPNTSVFRIDNAWFVVAFSNELKNKPLAVMLNGIPLVLFRSQTGVSALLDRCPHRNVPLSAGKVKDGQLECGYHGWRFDGRGECVKIPSLLDKTIPKACHNHSYPCLEQDGLIWVYPNNDSEPIHPPYRIPQYDSAYGRVDRMVEAPGTMHATIENALDVPHTAFLHGGLFRNEDKRNPITARVKRLSHRVEAEYIGEPRPTGIAAKILSPSGGIVTHFDRFELPSILEVEYRIGDENHIHIVAAASPVGDYQTRLFAVIQFNVRLPHALVKPFLEPLANRIFAQDAEMLALQSDTIERFGGEQFVSTPIDILGPHIYKLMKQAAQSGWEVNENIEYQKDIELEV